MPEIARWTFNTVCAASDPVGPRNDDAFGHALERLWVLDGATGVAPRRCTRDSSDAAWLAEAASHWLASDARTPRSAGPLLERLDELQDFLRAAFVWEQGRSGGLHPSDIEMPCACLGVAQIESDQLAIACVGDVSIVVSWPDGRHQVWSDPSSAAAGARTLQAWRNAQDAGLRDAALWEAVRPVILNNRHAVNRPGGYKVIHPSRNWTPGLDVHHLPLADGMRVLLASDGLWRLVDLFGSFSAIELLDAIDRMGWSPILTQLRALEGSDADAVRHPRVKRCDDATAVLARVQLAGDKP